MISSRKKVKSVSQIYKKALVTGGAGFIGSHLVDSLLGDGLEVICLDNFVSGKNANLEHARSYGTRFKCFDCSIAHIDKIKNYFDGVDVIFNLAASKMTVCLSDPQLDLAVNAGGTLNIMLLAKEFKIKKVVHVSTGSVYGRPETFPTTEEHPFNPSSYYGVSKLAGERYVNTFHNLFGIDTTILRYYHVYGPRQDASPLGGVVSIFCKNLLERKPITVFGDGKQIRSLTFVKDVVDLTKYVACHPGTRGQAFNCASGVQISLINLIDGIKKALGTRDVIVNFEDWRVGDIKYFEVSNEKIRSLGFEFKEEFSSGLDKTLSWFKTIGVK